MKRSIDKLTDKFTHKFIFLLLMLTLFTTGCATTELPPVDSDPVEPTPVELAPTDTTNIEQVLSNVLAGYYGPDISVSMDNNSLVIKVFNFPPYGTVLTKSQKKGLEILRAKLFDELKSTDYGVIVVEGHANPTATRGEAVELQRISQSRAETMSAFLRGVGITVNSVQGLSGERLLGGSSTDEGRSLNRRVETIVEIKQ